MVLREHRHSSKKKKEKVITEEDIPHMHFTQRIFQARYVLALMALIGYFFNYSLRANISVAIIAMVNHTAVYNESNPQQSDGPFIWDDTEQGWVLSAIYFGCLISDIPAGIIGDKIGGKHLNSIGIGVGCASTLFQPWASYHSWQMLFLTRLILGLGIGFAFPAMHCLMTSWIPPDQRGTIGAVSFSGTMLGVLVTNSITGIISEEIGWEINFYIIPAIGLVWAILWEFLIFETPDLHPRITKREKDLIAEALQDSKDHSGGPMVVPWKDILLSLPVWSTIIGSFTYNYYNFTIMAYLPIYINDGLGYTLVEAGTYSGLLFGLVLVMTIAYGIFADYLLREHCFSRTAIRKIIVCWALFGIGASVFLIAFLGEVSQTVGMLLLVFGSICNGGALPSLMANQIDISPNFAGSMLGLSIASSYVMGIISPIINGYILDMGDGYKRWQLVHLICGGFVLFGGIWYLIFASAEEQSWNEPDRGRKQIEHQLEERKQEREEPQGKEREQPQGQEQEQEQKQQDPNVTTHI